MVKSKKKFMRRKIAQAVGHQMKTVQCLIEVQELFAEFHPEWIPFFQAIENNCMVTISFIRNLAVKAWGYFPNDLDKWLK